MYVYYIDHNLKCLYWPINETIAYFLNGLANRMEK